MSQLEQNSTSLDEVLAMVNALPDAGGGGTVETCTITYYADTPMSGQTTIYYTDGSGQAKTESVSRLGSVTFNPVKNSIVAIENYGDMSGVATGGANNVTLLCGLGVAAVVFVSGDAEMYC